VKLFEVKNVCKSFKGLKALSMVNFSIEDKEDKGNIIGLIGPNGAGKTTLFNCITGFYKVTSGNIFFKGEEITNLSAEEICKKGIARTFQISKTFQNMTVLENVMVGAFNRTNSFEEANRKALEILDFIDLISKKNYYGSELTAADERMLDIARVLATDPKMILLDEVMSGLTQSEADLAMKMIKKIQGLKISIIVVEHVMEIVMPLSERVIVLRAGKKIADGHPLEVSKKREVIESYLGGGMN